MRLPSLTTAIVILVAWLAGCSEAPLEPEADFDDLGLQASEGKGILRGVVVDAAIRPIAGATVLLKTTPPQSVTTGDEGTFGFSDLEPGAYFLEASKVGFLTAQQGADVVAGDLEPAAVKMQLLPNGKPAPFAGAYVFEGIIECGTSAVALCGAGHDVVVIACTETPVCPPQPTNDQYSGLIFIDSQPDYLQSEMVWASTQALSTDMSYSLRYADEETYNGGMYEGGFGSFEGPSPLLGNVSGEDIADAELGNRTHLVFSIFSGTGSYPVGVTVAQRYAMYVHTFYGFQPEPGWRFSTDGEPRPPT